MTSPFHKLSINSDELHNIDKKIELGKQIRKDVPRATHSEYKVSSKRRDPVAIIKEQDTTRIQELVPIRHARMLTSSFAFLRGTAKIMIEDIGNQATSKIPVLANGDMHVTSAIVCAQFLGGDKVQCEAAAREIVKNYREKMALYAQETNLNIWYKTIQMNDLLTTMSPEGKKELEAITTKAQKKTQLGLFEKMSQMIDDRPQIKSSGPLLTREINLDSSSKTQNLEG